MAWSKEKQTFEVHLAKVAIGAGLCVSSSIQSAKHRKTIKDGRQFLTNLEVLNDFYTNDASIEAVLRATNSYFSAFNQLQFAKRDIQSETNQKLDELKRALDESYAELIVKSQQLVNKMESPEFTSHRTYKVRLSSFFFGCGVGVAMMGVLTLALATWPLGVAALSFGVVSLVIGALIAVFSARNLHQNMGAALGTPLEEITDFINSLNPEPPVKSFRLNLDPPIARSYSLS